MEPLLKLKAMESS